MSAARPHLRTSAGLARLAASIAIGLVVLVALGGVVRATDSGLACLTWPGCSTPTDFLPAGDRKVWIEHTHRLWAGLVGVAIAVQGVWVLRRHRNDRGLLWPAVLAGVGVVAQSLLGAFVVWGLLRAELVTAHLGLANALLAVQLVLAVRMRGTADPGLLAARRSLLRVTIAAAGAVYVTLLVGGHLAGVGGWNAFVKQPARGLFALGPLGTDPATTNVAHRVLAVVVSAAVAVVVVFVTRSRVGGWPRRLATAAASLTAIQLALGAANLITDVAAFTVVPHLVVATLLWATLVLCVLALGRPPPEPDPAQEQAAALAVAA